MLNLPTYALALLAGGSVVQAADAGDCSLKSPLPSGEVCGVRGNIANVTRAQSQNLCNSGGPGSSTGGSGIVDSLETCRDYCLDIRNLPQDQPYGSVKPRLAHRLCYTFAFDTVSKRCFLFFQVPRAKDNPFRANDTHPNDVLGFEPDKSSNTVYYTVNCFNSCRPKCPSRPGSNLLDNPGFDDHAATVFPWVPFCQGKPATPPSFEIIAGGDSGDSTNFLRFPADNGGALDQARTPCPLQKYLVKADWRARPRTQPIKFSSLQLFTVRTPDVFSTTGDIQNAPTNWTTAAVSFVSFPRSPPEKLSDDGGLIFRIFGQYVDVDNASIVPLTDIVDTVGANAVSNGGFETGQLKPWLGFPSDQAKSLVQVKMPGLTQGQYALHLFGRDISGGYPPPTSIQQRGLRVTPFVPHVWHFDYKIFDTHGRIGPFNPFISVYVSDDGPFNYGQYETSVNPFTIQVNKTSSFEYIFTPTSHSITLELDIGDFDMILDNNYIKKALI